MKLLVGSVMMMVSAAACLDQPGAGFDEKTATIDQALVVCSSSCDRPTYNGQPVACASNTYCFGAAEGAYCLQDNGTYAFVGCTAAPSNPVCGDGRCDAGESCIADCGPVCGDGICSAGESCSADCGPPPGPVCGDGICEVSEHGWCNSDCWWWCPTCNEP